MKKQLIKELKDVAENDNEHFVSVLQKYLKFYYSKHMGNIQNLDIKYIFTKVSEKLKNNVKGAKQNEKRWNK